MSDSTSYDNTATKYNVSRILTPDYTLDMQKYEEYSPLFLSTTFALTYGLSFASIISVVVHTYLYHGKELWYRFKAARSQEDDIHMKMMKKYKEGKDLMQSTTELMANLDLAPDWWFLSIFLVMFGISFAVIIHWPTHLTWWGLIIAFIISFVWMVPLGMVQATTNIQIGCVHCIRAHISLVCPASQPYCVR